MLRNFIKVIAKDLDQNNFMMIFKKKLYIFHYKFFIRQIKTYKSLML